MEFRILGSLEVIGRDGIIDLRGAKRRGLVGCLVVHARQLRRQELNSNVAP
jgi:hypothetical protein